MIPRGILIALVPAGQGIVRALSIDPRLIPPIGPHSEKDVQLSIVLFVWHGERNVDESAFPAMRPLSKPWGQIHLRSARDPDGMN